MGLQAGRLRNRAVLQRPRASDERDSTGQPLSPWVDVADVWVAIEPLSARDSFAAQQAQSTVSHRLTMRYCAVETSWRVKWMDNRAGRERFFYFDGPLTSPDERHELLVGMAMERAK